MPAGSYDIWNSGGIDMKRERLFWATLLILAVGLVSSWFVLLGMKEENLSMAKEAQRADDYSKIQNVIAKHSYYYAAQEQWLELDTAWAKKRDDISYGHNHGYYYGREAVENYYGKKNEERRKQTLEMMSALYSDIKNVPENEGIGDMVIHTLTTPYIEIAEDRQTAKGVWMSVGLAAGVRNAGKPQYNWFWEKFGVDFVNEDGEWKIWHFQIYSDAGFSENVGTGTGGPPGGGQPGATGPGAGQALGATPPGTGAPQEVKAASPGQPQGTGASGGGQPPGGQSDMTKLVQMYEMYSATRVPQNVPELPAPYKTWEDTTPFIK